MGDMDTHMMYSGTSCWYYNSYSTGSILKGVNGSGSLLQNDLKPITNGDQVTVVVKDGQLSFAVNGVSQGTPVDLPKGTKVAMAVSLCVMVTKSVSPRPGGTACR